MEYLIIIPLYILASFIVGIVGSKRQIGYLKAFLISFFLTPLFGILIVLASKELPFNEQSKQERYLLLLKGFVVFSILLIPVLIIVFLKTMTTNSYDIPIYYETGVDNPLMECDFVENEQHRIPPFDFTNQYNEKLGSEDMKGKVTVVDFFFTSCPSICPVMSTEMERVNDVFRDVDDVQIYSISIDPEYDTPEVLMEYATLHQATKDKWHFLTGDKDVTYDLARCGFILPAMDGGDVPDDFVHSDKFVLVDEEGRIRGYYSGTNREEVDRLILEIKILLYGKE